MADYEYESNSFKSKEHKATEEVSEKRLEKVVKSPARKKKRNAFSQLGDIFIPEDIEDVKSRVLEDVIAPAIRDILMDALGAFLGVNARKDARRPISDTVSYRDYSSRDGKRKNNKSYRARNDFEFNSIIVRTRGEAEMILDQLDAAIDKFGFASVADLYDLAGLSIDYTANSYGWTSIRNATVVPSRGEYILKMPKAVPLD